MNFLKTAIVAICLTMTASAAQASTITYPQSVNFINSVMFSGDTGGNTTATVDTSAAPADSVIDGTVNLRVTGANYWGSLTKAAY